MTGVGVTGEGGQGPAPTAKKDAGVRKAVISDEWRVARTGVVVCWGDSGGFLEFESGGVAEGVEDAEEEIGGDVLGIAVHDGGDASAGSTSEASDLSVSQALALNDFDDF